MTDQNGNVEARMNRTEPESYQEFGTLPARLLGAIRSPRHLFRYLAERPRWVDVTLVTFTVMALCGAAFLHTEVGRQALVDEWERTALAFGREVSDAAYADLTAMSEHGAAYAVVNAFARGPLTTVLLATVIYGVFAAAGSPRATYRQVLAVAAHAGVILAIRPLLVTPLNYSRETLASPTTLARLFPMLDEASPAARFLGALDLFVVWWVVVLALGIALLYGRSTRATVAAFVGAYAAFAAVLAMAMLATGGTV